MNKEELKYKLPSEYAEKVGFEYAHSTTSMHKKGSGQFFTPKKISDFMGSLALPKSKKISILDPGCGTAILSCSLIEKLIEKTHIEEVNLKLFETDKYIIEETKKVILFLKEWLLKKGVTLNTKIEQKDFVLYNAHVFSINTLFGNEKTDKYDYIISNPPYFKIPKSDNRAQAAKELVYGQPNIYSIFMGLSAKLLKADGELIFITPRSFAAGNYFKAFRNSFFKDVSITNIHIFESRNKMFKKENVLQENIIVRAAKEKSTTIKVSVTESETGLNQPRISIYHTEELIDLNSKEKILFIPSNTEEANTLKVFSKWQNRLNDFNIQVSTGPVVAFRCKDFLVPDFSFNKKIVPLVWLHNIKEMEFVFPLKKGTKQGYIIDSEESRKVLLKNKNYILIRRFSSKDDKKRLICSPYFASASQFERIGIENHINYVYRPNGELSDEEVWGIAALLSSKLFDTYFRTFNGNTQVGASELKQIKLPPLEKIILIGKIIKDSAHPSKVEIESIIHNILFKVPYVKNRRSTSNIKRVGVA